MVMKRSSRKVDPLQRAGVAGNRQEGTFRRRLGTAGGTPLWLVKPDCKKVGFLKPIRVEPRVYSSLSERAGIFLY